MNKHQYAQYKQRDQRVHEIELVVWEKEHRIRLELALGLAILSSILIGVFAFLMWLRSDIYVYKYIGNFLIAVFTVSMASVIYFHGKAEDRANEWLRLYK